MATRELYDGRDFIVGQDIGIEDLWKPIGAVIEYNQDEFYRSTCGAYACFGAYSSYTGKVIKEEDRKKFIDKCIADKLITVGVGGYLYDITNAFVKWINIKHNTNIIYLRVKIQDSKKYQDLGWRIITGFQGNNDFKTDKNDNCVVDKWIAGDKDRGHCIQEYKRGWTQDNYEGNKCNRYFNNNYEKFINGDNHFINGYILAMTLDDKTKEQIKKDKATMEMMIKRGYINGKNLDDPMTRRQGALMIGRYIEDEEDPTLEDVLNKLIE